MGTYPNGAVVPAAVPYPYAATPLVAYTNGAVVPAETAEVAQAKAAFAAAGGVIANQVAYPGFWPYGGLVAHPNGAVVPAEPADVVAARAATQGSCRGLREPSSLLFTSIYYRCDVIEFCS